MPAPPAIGASLKDWSDWLDHVAPYGGPAHLELPRDLRLLTGVGPREIAALAAENWYRAQARDARGRTR